MALNAVQNSEPAANPTEKRGIRAVLIGPPSSGKGTQVILKKLLYLSIIKSWCGVYEIQVCNGDF